MGGPLLSEAIESIVESADKAFTSRGEEIKEMGMPDGHGWFVFCIN